RALAPAPHRVIDLENVGSERHVARAVDGNEATSNWREGELAILEGHTSWVASVAFLPSQRRALSGGYDGSVRIWDLIARREVHTRLDEHDGPVHAVAVSP